MTLLRTSAGTPRTGTPSSSQATASKHAFQTPGQLATTQTAKQAADAELERERLEAQKRLKTSWEGIFAKYGRDFEGVADEIDPVSGEVVVDNGHLRGLQDESDWEDDSSEAEPVEDTAESRKRKRALGDGNAGKPARRKTVTWAEGTGCEACRARDELDDSVCLVCAAIQENGPPGEKISETTPDPLPRQQNRSSGEQPAMPKSLRQTLPPDEHVLETLVAPQPAAVELPSSTRKSQSQPMVLIISPRKKMPETPTPTAKPRDQRSPRTHVNPSPMLPPPIPLPPRASPAGQMPLRKAPALPDDEEDELSMAGSPQVATPRALIKASPKVGQTPTRPSKLAVKGSRLDQSESDAVGCISYPGSSMVKKTTPTAKAAAVNPKSMRTPSRFKKTPSKELSSKKTPLERPGKNTTPAKQDTGQNSNPPGTAFNSPSSELIFTASVSESPKHSSSFDIWAVPSSSESSPSPEPEPELESSRNVWAPPSREDDPFYNPLWDDSHPDGTPAKFPPRPKEKFQFTTPKAPNSASRAVPKSTGGGAARRNTLHYGKRPLTTPRRKPGPVTPGWTTGSAKKKGAAKLLEFLKVDDSDEEGGGKAVKPKEDAAGETSLGAVNGDSAAADPAPAVESPTAKEPAVVATTEVVPADDAAGADTGEIASSDGVQAPPAPTASTVAASTVGDLHDGKPANAVGEEKAVGEDHPDATTSSLYPTPTPSAASPAAVEKAEADTAPTSAEEKLDANTVVAPTALSTPANRPTKCGDSGWVCKKRFCFECLQLDGSEDDLI